MKHAPIVVAGLFLVLLLADVGMLGNAAKLDVESKTYVEATLPKFLSDPTPENFLSFVTPQDKVSFDAAGAQKFFFNMRQTLGVFQSYDDLEGDLFSMVLPNGERITAAKYSARCHFDKASISATVSLRKTGDAWSLVRVDFATNTLGPALEGRKSTPS